MPIHRSVVGRAFGSVVGALPGIGTAVTTARAVKNTLLPARNTVPRGQTARVTKRGLAGKQLARELKFGAGNGNGAVNGGFQFQALGTGGSSSPGGCPEGFAVGPSGGCERKKPGVIAGIQRLVPGGETGFETRSTLVSGVGEAVMGRYGAALMPGIMEVERSVCLRGMQLGNDGLCYNKGAITNRQRQWPRGRRPLLTGGEMRAIGVASRAGAKMDRTTKRLRDLGMMKKLPAPRKAKAHAHTKSLPAVSIN